MYLSCCCCYSAIFLTLRVARQVILPLSVLRCTWSFVSRVTVPTRSLSSVQGVSSGQVMGLLILFVILILSPIFNVSTLTVVAVAFFAGVRSLSRRATRILSCLISLVSSSISVFMKIFRFDSVLCSVFCFFFVLKQCCTDVRFTVAR